MKRVSIVIILLLVSSLFVFACSSAGGPSEADVKQIASALLNQELPPDNNWGGLLMGTRLTKIDIIEVKERGKFNEQQKYYPIRVRLAGSCTGGYYAPNGNGCNAGHFDRVIEMTFSKDDYGKWRLSNYYRI